MNTSIKWLAAAFTTAATALAGGYAALTQYQGAGVNKAPVGFILFEHGRFSPQIYRLPRQLDLAVKDGDIAEARRLLQAGANPNLCTHFSGPALNDAADWVADIDMMRLLVDEFHADVNQPNIAGTRPLHKVIGSFNNAKAEEAFRFLLSRGADIDGGKNSVGCTPREWIKRLGKDNLQKILDDIEASRQEPQIKMSQLSPPSPG